MSRVLAVSRTFYRVENDDHVVRELPRVTTILGIIDKSGPLMGWAVKVERQAFESALAEVLTSPGILAEQDVYDRVMRAVRAQRSTQQARDDAANIGRGAHLLVQWHTRRMLGLDAGTEPQVPDKSQWAAEAWKDWARDVDFSPTHVEYTVSCPDCGYAGTVDWVGLVKGVPTLGDIKTGRAVYPESYLQVLAYRHAAAREGIASDAGLVLRLPKVESDPAFEAVPVPPMPFGYFIAAARLWRWKRLSHGEPAGPGPRKCPGTGDPSGLVFPRETSR